MDYVYAYVLCYRGRACFTVARYCKRVSEKALVILTGDTRKIFVSNKTVDKSHSARVLIGCKLIMVIEQVHSNEYMAS